MLIADQANPFTKRVGAPWQGFFNLAGRYLPGAPRLIGRLMARAIMKPRRRRYETDVPLVEFPAIDGVRLTGALFPGNPGSPAVVLLHGWGDSMAHTLPAAEVPRRLGHTVFAFDSRAHGRSGGKLSGFGYWELRDLAGALAFLESRGLLAAGAIAWGVSMGGVTALAAAPEEPRLRGLIIEGAYDCLADNIFFQAAQLGATPAMAAAMRDVLVRTHGIDIERMDLRRAAASLGPRPLLLVTGMTDAVIPVHFARRIFEAASGPKDLWVLPHVQHARAWRQDPHEYAARVETFLARFAAEG